MQDLHEILKQKIDVLEKKNLGLQKEISKDFVNQFVKNFKLPATLTDLIVTYLSIKPSTPVVWLSLSECTGCTESFLRSEIFKIEDLLLDVISLDYHDVLMADSGFAAKSDLESALSKDFLLVVEGGVCVGEELFATFGANAISAKKELEHIAHHAKMVFGVGTCAAYGGVQAAAPNPSGVKGITELLKDNFINIPGCPPSDVNIIMNLMYVILFDRAPELDSLKRPIWAYGKTVHDSCERKAKFESGDFVDSFSDERMKDGYCLYKVGCKGPHAYNNCGKVKFNSKTSWPIQAGHGCIACSEPDFWDNFGVYEEPLKNQFAHFVKPQRQFDRIQTIEDRAEFLKTLDQDSIGIFLDTTNSEIIYQGRNILKTSFEVNSKLILDALAKKSKLTGRLVENYQTQFQEAYSKNMNQNDDSQISTNLVDVFKIAHDLLYDQKSDSPHKDVINEASEFKFPQISDMDFSAKVSDSEISIDVTKGLRLILCYKLGGLENNGVTYGVVATLCKAIRTGVTKFINDNHLSSDTKIFLGGNLSQNHLIQGWVLRD